MSVVGTPNYITAEGAKRLQEELARLWNVDRPKVVQDVADAAAQGDRSENAEYIYGKRKLREIDRRIQFLRKRLEKAEVVPQRASGARVFFGAFVELEDEDGKCERYRIVGEDETDAKKGWISWRSPVGRALLKKEEGDEVRVRRPGGEATLTIVSVSWATEP